MEKIRIQKFFTDNSIMSRRAAEREILDGKITVNGVVANIGMKIDPDVDIVEYGGRRIEPKTQRKYTYIMLNKPRGYLSSVTDDRGRRCVSRLVSDCGVRVYPVGRLDMDSDGLLLLTDDGDFAYRLTHPKHNIPKHYHVTLKGKLPVNEVMRLTGEFELDGYRLLPVKVSVLNQSEGTTHIAVTLYEGRNRQIRRMCEICGFSVLSLTRTAIGEVKLGSLGRGKWRHLTSDEVEYLKSNTDNIKEK